jgi:hypothetical protein
MYFLVKSFTFCVDAKRLSNFVSRLFIQHRLQSRAAVILGCLALSYMVGIYYFFNSARDATLISKEGAVNLAPIGGSFAEIIHQHSRLEFKTNLATYINTDWGSGATYICVNPCTDYWELLLDDTNELMVSSLNDTDDVLYDYKQTEYFRLTISRENILDILGQSTFELREKSMSVAKNEYVGLVNAENRL